MAKEKLLGRLHRIRELRLQAEAADLRARAHALSQVEASLERARSAAAQSIEIPRHLHELGRLGEFRLAHRRIADEMGRQVNENSEKVARARKLAEAARDACREVSREKEAIRERAAETEAENFFGWKRGARQ